MSRVNALNLGNSRTVAFVNITERTFDPLVHFYLYSVVSHDQKKIHFLFLFPFIVKHSVFSLPTQLTSVLQRGASRQAFTDSGLISVVIQTFLYCLHPFGHTC